MVRACHKRSKTGNSSAKGNLGHAGRNSFDLGTALELAAIRKGLSAMAVLPADIYIAVNVSPETVLSGDLSDILRGMPTGWIVLEITEHAQVPDCERLVAALHPLRVRGVRLAVDDAGAGIRAYSTSCKSIPI